jgi:oligopeptide/dipeptide ABC transporter ATP-binding protein
MVTVVGEVLRVDGLSVRYAGQAHPAVRDVSFAVARAGSIGLVGESGSGKSTTAMAIARLLDPTAEVEVERLEFEGVDLTSLDKRRLAALRGRRMGFVFQDPAGSWNPSRRISAQLLDGLRAARATGDLRHLLIEQFQAVGIRRASERLDDYPHQFSGGMLQRAMIAGALALRPALLIADEPTSALDATVQAELLALLDRLRHEADAALIIVSHDLAVVRRVADEVLVLYGGRVVERGATAVTFSDPQHPYTRGLVAAIPTKRHQRKQPLPVMTAGRSAAEGCPFRFRCAFADDVCTTVPPLRSVAGRDVACHHVERIPTIGAA